jgi:long-chain acyl-CoA synthetase
VQALGVTEPRCLIVDATRRNLLDGLDRGAYGIDRIVIAGGDEDQLAALLNGDAACPAVDQPEGQPALIFFSSGSTGKPKGVLHTHSSALAILTSTCDALDGVDARDRILVCEPQVHPSGFIATFSVFLCGGTVRLLPQFDEALYIAALRTMAPSLIVAHIDIVAKLLQAPEIRREDFASLRGVYTGGNVVPPARQRQFREFTGLPIQVGWGAPA